MRPTGSRKTEKALTDARIANEAELTAAQIKALHERTMVLRAWVQARIGDQRRRTDAAIDSQMRRDRLGRDALFFEDWQAIDQAEVGRGEPHGRPRVKFVRVDEMLESLGEKLPG